MAKAMFNSRFLAILLLVGFAAVSQVRAQFADQHWTDSMGGSFNNPMSAFASTLIWNHINEQVMANAVKGNQAGTSSSRAGSGNQSNAAGRPVASSDPQTQQMIDSRINQLVRFHPTGTRLMLQTLSGKLGGNANQQAQTSQLLSALMQSYENEASRKGYPNDLALAVSSFIAFNCAAYQQKPIAPDDKILILRELVGVLAVQNGSFSALSDLQKQQTYETLIMTGGLAYLSYQDAKKRNSTNEMALFSKFAGQNLKSVLGVEPGALDFTAEGLQSVNIQTNEAAASDSVAVSGGPIDIGQLRLDYSDNVVRADEIYKGKRFLFTGAVIEVSGTYYKSNGKDEVGRYTYTNMGTNLRVANTGGNSLIGWGVYCFFQDNKQLGPLSRGQKISLEATVQGREEGGTNLILVNAVLR